MNKPEIIGLCGRQFSGKSMLAKYLVEHKGYERLYVAQALKHLCSELFNLSVEEMDKLKWENKEFKLSEDDLKHISEVTSIPLETTIKDFETIGNTLTSIRHAYQFIGTEFIRKYNPNWHMDMMLKGLSHDKRYVVDDVRFKNESDAINDMGGKLAYIVRPLLLGVSHHASEETLNWRMFDHIIVNNLDEKHVIDQLLEFLEKGSNSYGEMIVSKYHDDFKMIYNKSNKKIVIDRAEYPAKISIHDRTTEWIDEEVSGVTNPLFIEDFKPYV